MFGITYGAIKILVFGRAINETKPMIATIANSRQCKSMEYTNGRDVLTCHRVGFDCQPDNTTKDISAIKVGLVTNELKEGVLHQRRGLESFPSFWLTKNVIAMAIKVSARALQPNQS